MRGAIAWAVKPEGGETRNHLGYGESSRQLQRFLGQSVDLDDSAPVAVHYCYPRIYKPLPGRMNVLYTMFESPILDEYFPPAFESADLILTPSHWCAEVFRAYTDTPVEVVPLGVDLGRFRYRRRRHRPGQSRRLLYVGAPNYRKLTILPSLFEALIRRLPGVELYIKTTGADTTPIALERMMRAGLEVDSADDERIVGPGYVVDNRRLPADELEALYHSASGFVHLHCGEGWGLTSLEAMATGLAPIVSDWSGTRDFTSPKTAYLVDVDYGPIETEDPTTGRRAVQHLGWPDYASAMDRIAEWYRDPRRAEKKGRAAAEVAARYSWRATARRFCTVLRRYGMLPAGVRRGARAVPQASADAQRPSTQ